MSLVGPRAMSRRDFELFNTDTHRRRFSVKPGITCLWQVNGRNSIPFEQWMELDLQYIDKWSIWLDVKILARTLPAVWRGTGAALSNLGSAVLPRDYASRSRSCVGGRISIGKVVYISTICARILNRSCSRPETLASSGLQLRVPTGDSIPESRADQSIAKIDGEVRM